MWGAPVPRGFRELVEICGWCDVRWRFLCLCNSARACALLCRSESGKGPGLGPGSREAWALGGAVAKVHFGVMVKRLDAGTFKGEVVCLARAV